MSSCRFGGMVCLEEARRVEDPASIGNTMQPSCKPIAMSKASFGIVEVKPMLAVQLSRRWAQLGDRDNR